jgi:DNA-binding PadR family transcriptional regulator
VLSLLMRWPAHGYLIARIINDMIGPYAKISNGRLYPLLSKLEENELIDAVDKENVQQSNTRHSRSYQITEKGRRRFHQLMMDTTSNPGEYQRIFGQKVAVMYLLEPDERLELIDHYIKYCQAHLRHTQTERADLVQHNHAWGQPSELVATLSVMEHTIDLWQLEFEWARSLREREETSGAAQKPDRQE